MGLDAWLSWRDVRVGKIISINGEGYYRTVVIEHPYETLPPQDFPEYEVNNRPPPHGGKYAK